MRRAALMCLSEHTAFPDFPPCIFESSLPPLPSLQRHGTEVDRKAALGHKPLGVKDGSQIKFGTHPNSFVLRCESSGK